MAVPGPQIRTSTRTKTAMAQVRGLRPSPWWRSVWMKNGRAAARVPGTTTTATRTRNRREPALCRCLRQLSPKAASHNLWFVTDIFAKSPRAWMPVVEGRSGRDNDVRQPHSEREPVQGQGPRPLQVQRPSSGDSHDKGGTKWPFGTNQVAQTCSDLTHITGVPLKYVCHSGGNYIIRPVIQY